MFTIQKSTMCGGVLLVKILREDVFELQASGADVEAVRTNLKMHLDCLICQGKHAQEIYDWLLKEGEIE